MRPQLALHYPGQYDGWIPVAREDSLAAEIADRHYSRQTPGAHGFMPPGRCVVFVHVGREGLALWGVVLNLDPVGTLRWRNTIFRNESDSLSSQLVESATFATYLEWTKKYGALPDVALTTEIDIKATERRRSRWVEPGHCYRMAGWREVARRGREHGRPAIVVLEAPR